MVYVVIAQYRTGGQNLINWIRQSDSDKFITIHEPFNKKNNVYTIDTSLQDFSWLQSNQKYFLKELWYPDLNYKKLLEISNKTICLYRENTHEQTISHIYSTKTNKYHHQYTPKDIELILNQNEYEQVKSDLEYNKKTLIDFAKSNKINTISYEELYYRNGIEIFKKHFNLDNNNPFPFGTKYFRNVLNLI